MGRNKESASQQRNQGGRQLKKKVRLKLRIKTDCGKPGTLPRPGIPAVKPGAFRAKTVTRGRRRRGQTEERQRNRGRMRRCGTITPGSGSRGMADGTEWLFDLSTAGDQGPCLSDFSSMSHPKSPVSEGEAFSCADRTAVGVGSMISLARLLVQSHLSPRSI